MNKSRKLFAMKWLAFLFLMLTLAIASAQTSVRFTFANSQYIISQYTNVQVILQPEQLNASGSVTLSTAKIYKTTDTNASVTFSNLSGSYTGGYYHWTVPAFTSPNGYNPPNTIQGDIQVVSTNLGLIDSTTIGVVFTPVYSGFGASWTAQSADQRYSASSNNLSSYVQVGQLTSTSNSLAALIVAATNGQTSIVYSNPSAFVTPSQATNIAQSAYNANPSNYATLNQVASTNLTALNAATNTSAVVQSNLSQAITATNANIHNDIALTNTALLQSIANTNAANLVTTASLIATASNALALAKQPSSAILTNLANTGAFTNAIAAGSNITITTNSGVVTIASTASGGTTYTNNASGLPGVVLGSGIGTNLTSYAKLTDATNAANVVYSNNAAGYIRTNDSLNAYNISDASGQLAGLWNTNVVTVQNSNIGGINTDYVLSGVSYFYTSLAGGYIITNIPNGFTNSVASCPIRCWVIASPASFSPDFYQGFTTNTIPIGYWTPSFAPFHSGANSHFQNQGVTASNNNTNYVLASDFAVDAVTFTNSFQPTNANLSAWALYSTNSKVASTDARVVNAVTNISQLTNVALFGQVSFGTKTNFLITTNIVGIIGAGSPTVDGTYANTALGNTWTNPFDARMTIALSAGTYFLQSNSVSLYSSANIVTWTAVNGVVPSPIGAWGSVWNLNGVKFSGVQWSTNLTAQILAAQAAFAATGSVAAATSATFAGIASNSPAGAFGTAAIVDTNRFLLSGASNKDGNLITNLNGASLAVGTVSSNAFDAGTLARLYAVGGTNDAVLQISNNLLVRLVGGTLNTNTSANGSVIIGGSGNTAFGTFNSVILGGAVNGLGNTANHSTMLGGQYNTNLLSDFATIAGGQYNLMMGDWSTVLGGTNNQSLASYTSILGGNGGRAAHQGVTIIGDSQSTSNRSFTNDMMLLRFANGVTINTNNPNGYALNVNGTVNATNFTINGTAISGSTAGAVTTNNGAPLFNGTQPILLYTIGSIATNLSTDTNTVYMSGAGDATYNLKYVWNTGIKAWTNGTAYIGYDSVNKIIYSAKTTSAPYNINTDAAGFAAYIGTDDPSVVGFSNTIVDAWTYVNGPANAPTVTFATNGFTYLTNWTAVLTNTAEYGNVYGNTYGLMSGEFSNARVKIHSGYASQSEAIVINGTNSWQSTNGGRITVVSGSNIATSTNNAFQGMVRLSNIEFPANNLQLYISKIIDSNHAYVQQASIGRNDTPSLSVTNSAAWNLRPPSVWMTDNSIGGQNYGSIIDCNGMPWVTTIGDQGFYGFINTDNGATATWGYMSGSVISIPGSIIATSFMRTNSASGQNIINWWVSDLAPYSSAGVNTNGVIVANYGVASYATNAAVSLGAAGVTNNMGCNAGAYVTATGTSWIIKNRANATIYTSPTLTATVYVHLQPGWSVSAASGLAGTLLPE